MSSSRSPKPDTIDAIAHYLRGDFDFIPTADAILDDVRKQLDQLTQEQRIVLDVLHDSARVLRLPHLPRPLRPAQGARAPHHRPPPRQRPTRPHLRPAPQNPVTWSTAPAFKRLENDVVILAPVPTSKPTGAEA
jgi:hypothetical protein